MDSQVFGRKKTEEEEPLETFAAVERINSGSGYREDLVKGAYSLVAIAAGGVERVQHYRYPRVSHCGKRFDLLFARQKEEFAFSWREHTRVRARNNRIIGGLRCEKYGVYPPLEALRLLT